MRNLIMLLDKIIILDTTTSPSTVFLLIEGHCLLHLSKLPELRKWKPCTLVCTLFFFVLLFIKFRSLKCHCTVRRSEQEQTLCGQKYTDISTLYPYVSMFHSENCCCCSNLHSSSFRRFIRFWNLAAGIWSHSASSAVMRSSQSTILFIPKLPDKVETWLRVGHLHTIPIK